MKSDVEAPPERLSATFGRAGEHRRIGELIRRRSTNKGDIYRIALEGLGYETPVSVLDLGCGWGAFTAALRGVAPVGSRVIGVDWMEDNRGPFIGSAASAGVSGEFLCGPVEQICDLPARGFDVVLSGFSLYFFTGILPQIVRVLKDDGVFVAITHSNNSLHEFLDDVRAPLMHEGQMTPELFGVEAVLHEFNSENGAGILAPFFGEVERTEFNNRLRFGVDQVEECFDYLMFKRYILTDSSEYRHQIEARRFHDELKAVILARAGAEGAYTLAKDDAIFRCRKPAKDGRVA